MDFSWDLERRGELIRVDIAQEQVYAESNEEQREKSRERGKRVETECKL